MLNSRSPAGVLYKALKSNSNNAWATINKINRQAAALRCSPLCRIATPCQDLASKDSIGSENKPTLQHESPCAGKMQDWEAWVRGQRIAMTIWYDPERSIRIWCLHEDDGLSFPYRLQKFSLFLLSSYRLQTFADTDRLRVNRRPIRKDFFPDRYDFVPIVFTSSSCKRGLRLGFLYRINERIVFLKRVRSFHSISYEVTADEQNRYREAFSCELTN